MELYLIYLHLQLVMWLLFIKSMIVIIIMIRFTLSNKRQFKKEMVITACFYLVSKIVEDMKRIRDILVSK